MPFQGKILIEDLKMIDAKIVVSSPYGPEAIDIKTGKDGKAYLNFFSEFCIEVRKNGYKHYFGCFKNKTKIEIVLFPKNGKIYFYEKIKEYDTGFGIWLIKASKDRKYIAVSQGLHSGISQPVNEAYIMLFDSSGNSLWKYKINTTGYENLNYCWGVDISQNGDYIAAGCFNGFLYLFDRKDKLVSGGKGMEILLYDENGSLLWKRRIDHVAITGSLVRKKIVFGTHGKYLLVGNKSMFDR